MSKRSKPIEKTQAWIIYRELIDFVLEYQAIPTIHSLWDNILRGRGYKMNIGTFQYGFGRLCREGYIKLVQPGSLITIPALTILKAEASPKPDTGAHQMTLMNLPLFNGKGHVYLLRARNGLYKIGASEKLEQRLASLQVPLAAECIHTIPSRHCYRIERELHDRYAACRVDREWFRLSDEDVRDICAIKEA